MPTIQLPQKFVDLLITLPENGMGYQIVDIKLQSGEILRNRIILNSEFLKVLNNESIKPEDIIVVELSRKENGS